jgi:hypothetical protein
LYKLLAQGRISPRQGAVLAYIGSLVLRSLKAIDYDLDRFSPKAESDLEEESVDIAADSDDEPDDKQAGEPAAEPVAANSVGPGEEPLPATAQEFAAKVLKRKPN